MASVAVSDRMFTVLWTLVGGLLVEVLVVLALAVKHRGTAPAFAAIKSWYRLHAIFASIRMSRFTRARADYSRYGPDVSSLDRYIASARRQLKIVGINLVTGNTQNNLCNAIEHLLRQATSVDVYISLLNPKSQSLMEAFAPVIDVPPSQMAAGIQEVLDKLSRIRKNLPPNERRRLHLFAHNIQPFASAILIDPHEPTGRIQIETNCYRTALAFSWGFELRAGGSHPFYKTLVESFEHVISDADVIEDSTATTDDLV